MNKLQPIGIRFSKDEREALIKEARLDGRPLSSLARKIIVDFLKQRGRLK